MDSKENDINPGPEPSEGGEPISVEECADGSSDTDELAAMEDKYLRVLAEFDNFRKRTAKEKVGMYDDGIIAAASKLLPTLDNLRRALDAAPSMDDALYKGVDMTLGQLIKAFEELGVEEVPAQPGQPFDPVHHFAVAHTQDEQLEKNVVAEELQKGYVYKGRVVRHAMVKAAN